MDRHTLIRWSTPVGEGWQAGVGSHAILGDLRTANSVMLLAESPE